jgi:hypothetical protein
LVNAPINGPISRTLFLPTGASQVVAPLNARFARIEHVFWETVGHSASTNFRVGYMALFPNVLAPAVGWQDIGSTIGYQNGWTNYGGAYQTGRHLIDAVGFCHLDGVISSGTVGAAMFTCPQAVAPSVN